MSFFKQSMFTCKDSMLSFNLEDYFENMPDICLLAKGSHAKDIKIIKCNSAACKTFGYSAQTLKELNLIQIIHPDHHHRFLSNFNSHLKQRSVSNYRINHISKNGKKIPTLVSAYLFLEDNEIHVFAILRETSHFIKVNEFLKKQNIYLQQLNDDFDIFSKLLAHDMKGPFLSINALCHFIMEDDDKVLSQNSKEHLKLIMQRVNRGLTLVEDTLKYLNCTVPDSSQPVVSIKDLIQDILQTIYKPKDFEVLSSASLQNSMTNSTLLKRVIHNLITNAIKHHHNPTDGYLSIDGLVEDNDLVLNFTDNGPGIDAKFLPYIFDPFKGAKSKDVVEGSGIGLTSIDKILKKVGGRIKINTNINAGSSFIIYWPIDKLQHV